MSAVSLEERVAAVETELARLKERLEQESQVPVTPWWKRVVGVYRDDPEFEAAMRLGREYRESLRPEDDAG
jgi:hypothetical protein